MDRADAKRQQNLLCVFVHSKVWKGQVSATFWEGIWFLFHESVLTSEAHLSLRCFFRSEAMSHGFLWLSLDLSVGEGCQVANHFTSWQNREEHERAKVKEKNNFSANRN
jgi:hypothetical protein